MDTKDPQLVQDAFRNGVSDVLTLPEDFREIEKVIQALS